jgi:hypothetical protein
MLLFERSGYMVQKKEGGAVMNFMKISETYPDAYILVKIVEIDHSKGREAGTVLYTGDSRDELASLSKSGEVADRTIILQGENLIPVMGGVL